MFEGIFWKGTIEFRDKARKTFASVQFCRIEMAYFDSKNEKTNTWIFSIIIYRLSVLYFNRRFTRFSTGKFQLISATGKLLFEEQLRALERRSLISKTGKWRSIAVTKGTTSRLFYEESVHNWNMTIKNKTPFRGQISLNTFFIHKHSFPDRKNNKICVP